MHQKFKKYIHAPMFAFAMVIFFNSFANAEMKPAQAIDMNTKQFVNGLANRCVGSWESQPCLEMLAAVSMNVTAHYAQSLKNGGHEHDMEDLKQSCAASTAAMQQDVPAYAMKSAMTECANKISDINDDTQISPNVNHYQMIVIGVMCLGEDPSCAMLEKQITSMAGQ